MTGGKEQGRVSQASDDGRNFQEERGLSIREKAVGSRPLAKGLRQ